MISIEIIFIVSFIASFLGTMLAFIVQFWLYRKQLNYMEKMKKSIQRTVRRLKEEREKKKDDD